MQSLSDKQELIIVDASRIIHQLQFDSRSDNMYKFDSLLFGASALVIFILELHVNGVCARVMTIPQPNQSKRSFAVMELLEPEDPSKTTVVHGKVKCVLMKEEDKPHYHAYPRFRIETEGHIDITDTWSITAALKFYECSSVENNHVLFYRIEAKYGGTRRLGEITYPDDEGVKVEIMQIPPLQTAIGGNTARITFTYYRSHDNDAKDEVKLDRGAKVELVTGTIFNKIWNALT